MGKLTQKSVVSSLAAGDTLAGVQGGVVVQFPRTLAAPPATADSVLAVSAVNGNDSTGTRGRLDLPFLTPAAAQAAAQSGDCIIVYPGNYAITAPLGANGVNWYLYAGANLTLNCTNTATTQSLFTDGGAAMTYVVDGKGTLGVTGTQTSGTAPPFAIYISNASSSITIRAASIFNSMGFSAGSGLGGCVWGAAGNLTVDSDQIIGGNTTASAVGIYWTNGTMSVHGKTLTTNSTAVYSSCTAGGATGDCFLVFDQIVSAASVAVEFLNGNSNTKLWVQASLISSNAGYAVTNQGGGKLYVIAEKIVGCPVTSGLPLAAVALQGGFSWIIVQKITATYKSHLRLTGGVNFVSVLQLEDLGNADQGILCTGGTTTVAGVSMALTVGSGVNISAGVLNLISPQITTPGGGTYDINNSGGTVNVSGGFGTNSNGSFVTSGTVTYKPIVPVAANPTATAGVAAVNGSAATFMRSDGAPALPALTASGAGHQAGLAPDPGGSAGTTHFLREDATWAVPPSTTYLADGTTITLTGSTFSLTSPIAAPTINNPTINGLIGGTAFVRAALTGAVTNASATPATITGMSFAIGANEVWIGEAILQVTGAAGGMKIQMTGPASPTAVLGTIFGSTTVLGTFSVSTFSGFSTLDGTTFAAFVGTTMVRVAFMIQNGSTPGTVAMQFNSAAGSNTISVNAGSIFWANRQA